MGSWNDELVWRYRLGIRVVAAGFEVVGNLCLHVARFLEAPRP